MYLSKPCKQSQQRLGTLPPRTSHGIRDVPDVARQTTDNYHRKILLKRRQHHFLNPVDVLAIQEPLTQPGDFRLSLTIRNLQQCAGASKWTKPSATAEYVAATIHVREVEFTVVSVYVAPGSTAVWDARILRDIARQCPSRLLFCGDFNAHNTTWGDNRTTPRGSALEDVTTTLGLEALNDGSETFVRQGVHGSVLDLTFAPRNIAASWTVIADTRAQRKAHRTNTAADWQHHRKIDAKFRRHTTRLQREQWNQLCASFGSPRGLTKAWKIARTLSAEKLSTHPTAGLANSLQLTLEATAELLADEFSRNIPSPAGYRPFTISPPDGPPPFYFNTDFTVDELKAALAQCTRRSAPGPDGVTYQALRNIDECHYPNLLDALNHVWQTSEIPDAWKLSHVIPIPKSGKPLTSPESYRPISMTSCVGKLLERLVLRRLTWHLDATEALPAVKRLLMQCRQLLGLLRKFRAHSQQGLPPNGLLTLYEGLIKSKFLYSLPLANIGGPQRDQLERSVTLNLNSPSAHPTRHNHLSTCRDHSPTSGREKTLIQLSHALLWQ
ncbi:hypothetical protein HPB47_013367 [Ixodes persulcatus]|uniref:Uncharacterized protein n=1 Tax=Ixodes persulcatus TaxID=34615 RepID=A0AC60QYX4_IXOPE|nr:hypothetical protein HPB47_013367 [Ixodes persulcatus]